MHMGHDGGRQLKTWRHGIVYTYPWSQELLQTCRRCALAACVQYAATSIATHSCCIVGWVCYKKETGLNRTRLDYSFGIHGWHAQIQLQWMCVQDWHLRLCIISCLSYQLEVSWFWNGFELVSLAKKKNMVTRNFAIVGRFICLFLIILKILLLARLVET